MNSSSVSSPRVLVVEDNPQLIANLFAYFEVRGYLLDAARDGASGLQLAGDAAYDAIIVDWNLPRMQGVDLIRQLREAGAAVPVIMLTARDELADKLLGFANGADDYLTKPFALEELDARLQALMVRARGRRHSLEVHDLHYDLTTQTITRADRTIALHAAGRKILQALMRASPAVVSRPELETLLWGDAPPDSDILRSHIYDLRKAIDGPFEAKLLRTLSRVGYRLAPPDHEP